MIQRNLIIMLARIIERENMLYRITIMLLFIITCSCSFYAPQLKEINKPTMVAQEYSLNEIKEYFPEYHTKLLKPLALYEQFKSIIIDTSKGLEDILININTTQKTFFINSVINSKYALIGLESIDIDSAYFENLDSVKVIQPLIKIFKYPIPIIDYTTYEYESIGPIEDYFIINCDYAVGYSSRHSLEMQVYKIKLHTKYENSELLINSIELINTDSLGMTVPYMLRPIIWFKQ
ncbi:hypothetical protein JXO59_14240 [candidate division KSB1 bacterium]|nr:hypothetical protein [candidate division KSB1 bacterium]